MRHHWFKVIFLSFVTVGCGGTENKPATESDMEQNALNDVAELYRVYTIQFKKPPAKLADFAPMEPMSPLGVAAVTKGEVVVRFGATLPNTDEGPGKGPGDEVLAYQKKVPESGGQVLMLNRTIKAMTSDEFKAAKLAGTSSSDEAAATAKKPK
ncbi:hypothetical protein [Singulisphaera acidiphila]|uniref:Lipoprotein n=1 Tax=Singulisphaera acidiphila (strain ATCC BAA-1392 / DSM 18658 / VKM B-2454 / MOB10) TaxID=886293 RepID=L0DKZ2_SINAD|nr:hypothetical protein [Singulisphaera acidiphila]AGA29902.1 hypothetical protein Sinac_5774 [Singulisphaera acidiphila DSM 18658]